MPNGRNNKNSKKEIELLPLELRRPEEKKKEKKPEIKMFIPPSEEKVKGPTFLEKIFGTREEREKKRKEKQARREAKIRKKQEEKEKLELLRKKKEVEPAKQPVPAPKFISPKVVPSTKVERRNEAKKEIPPGIPAGPPPRRKFGITLIPQEIISPLENKVPKQIAILVVVILILGGLAGALFGYLKWSEKKLDGELKNIEVNLTDINQQIKDLKAKTDQAQILQRQLKIIRKILNQHIYWTNFFVFLEKNTVEDVYFQNFMGTSDGQITMSGIAKSYNAVAKQIVALQEEEAVEKVSIASASASLDTSTGEIIEVNFDAKFKLQPAIFLK